MSMTKIMKILIFYHYSHYKNFKHYYDQYVCKDLKQSYPVLLSYDCFIWYIPVAYMATMYFYLFRCKPSNKPSQ
jgi:hypothetical protein